MALRATVLKDQSCGMRPVSDTNLSPGRELVGGGAIDRRGEGEVTVPEKKRSIPKKSDMGALAGSLPPPQSLGPSLPGS